MKALDGLHGEQILRLSEVAFPVHLNAGFAGSACIMLPFDSYFDIRARFAIRMWKALVGRDLGRDPGTLTNYRRTLLVTQLRALDGRLDGASYTKIAEVLFAKPPMSAASWKSHDLRARTVHAVHRGFELMEGQYRQLLLHPYRRKVPLMLLRSNNLGRP